MIKIEYLDYNNILKNVSIIKNINDVYKKHGYYKETEANAN